MKQTDYHEHEALLQWLIGISLLLFIFYIAWIEGLFALLVESDRSRISLVIICGFILVSLHIAMQVVSLSRERNAAAFVRQLLSHSDSISLSTSRTDIICCEQPLGTSYIARHLGNLHSRLSVAAADKDTGNVQTHLLSSLDKRIRGQFKYGWLVADLMIKLGLIGTVIGFILMLSSVATIEDYDIATMQDLLRNMSGGMQVALFTTLSGLISGLLLGIQYQFLDRQADELLADIEELSEVYILPALLNPAVDKEA